jgi:hypothetical protein
LRDAEIELPDLQIDSVNPESIGRHAAEVD